MVNMQLVGGNHFDAEAVVVALFTSVKGYDQEKEGKMNLNLSCGGVLLLAQHSRRVKKQIKNKNNKKYTKHNLTHSTT